jgi:nucleotide-binding universal stress UspA family protein
MIVLKRLLVPTDFSEPSAIALHYAKAFAQNFHASLHILHVIEEKTLAYGELISGALPPLDLPHILEQIEKGVRDRLDQVLTEAERERFQAELVTVVGSPFLEIVRYAKAQDIDLIVMGTHGRGPVAHLLMGSVAERVVRKAPCPVLTVRHPEHEFVMP